MSDAADEDRSWRKWLEADKAEAAARTQTTTSKEVEEKLEDACYRAFEEYERRHRHHMELPGIGVSVSPRIIHKLPFACCMIGLAIVPLLWLLWFWRQRRLPEGTCKACGYDLRATPARCPECGTRS